MKVCTKVFFVIVQITGNESASLLGFKGAADGGKPLREPDARQSRARKASMRIIIDGIAERPCFQPEHFKTAQKSFDI